MLGQPVPRGAIFYIATRKRHEIIFDDAIRARTLAVIADVRRLLLEQEIPAAPNDERCPQCSLINACLPHVVGEDTRLRGFQGSLFIPLGTGTEE